MSIDIILHNLRSERDRLIAAINALASVTGTSTSTPTSAARRGRKPGRRMSAEARAKIAASAKRRWAAAKRAGKNSLAA